MLPSTDVKPPQVTDAPAALSNGNLLFRQVRRVIVFISGISVLIVGIVMIVAPGPAFVVIPLGLAILATEFVWARQVLHRLKQGLADAAGVSQVNLPRWVRLFVPKIRAKDETAPEHVGSHCNPTPPTPPC